MFHLNDGLFFERLPEGKVRIVQKEGGPEGGTVFFDLTVDANAWASVIASMSYYGEEHFGFYRALEFHTGEALSVEMAAIVEQREARLRDEPHRAYSKQDMSGFLGDCNAEEHR